MAKKPKLFVAFDGNAAGLRDVLIDHFKHEEGSISVTTGATWNEGVDAGKRLAYAQVVKFLKQLIINDDEHVDQADEPHQ